GDRLRHPVGDPVRPVLTRDLGAADRPGTAPLPVVGHHWGPARHPRRPGSCRHHHRRSTRSVYRPPRLPPPVTGPRGQALWPAGAVQVTAGPGGYGPGSPAAMPPPAPP